jgi:hypothetical protein
MNGQLVEDVALPLNANELWKVGLESRWKATPLDLEAIRRICMFIPPLPAEAVAMIMAPIKVSEVLSAMSKWGEHKVFTDYTVRCLSLLSEAQLQLVADEITRWVATRPPVARITIGIPKPGISSNYPEQHDELLHWLMKFHRPLSISPVKHALFNGVMAMRLRHASAIPHILSPAHVGFLPERSVHHVILPLVMALAEAESFDMELWIAVDDIDKAYDRAHKETQEETAARVGLRSLAENLQRAHVGLPTEAIVADGPPGMVEAETSFAQGDATVCYRFPLSIDPAIRAVRVACRDSDQQLHRVRIDQFADDGVLRANSLAKLIQLIELKAAGYATLGYKMGALKIACNAKAWAVHTFFDSTRTTVEIIGMTIPIVGSVRLLGACVHLRPQSACTEHRCTLCKRKAGVTTPLCTDCETQLPQKLAAWRTSPLDNGLLPLPLSGA